MEKKFGEGLCEMTQEELFETAGGGWLLGIIILGALCTIGGCSKAAEEDAQNSLN